MGSRREPPKPRPRKAGGRWYCSGSSTIQSCPTCPEKATLHPTSETGGGLQRCCPGPVTTDPRSPPL